MRVGEYRSFMERALPAGKLVMVVGDPGVGKTVVKMELCARLGWDYIGICTPLYDPAFLMGFPYRENGTANFAPFGEIARALNATKPTLLDFDELPAASETLIKAALRLFQFLEVGNRRLPDCVMLGASGNNVGVGTGVYGLLEPMKDRFDTIITVEPHVDDTVSYGLAAGWPSWLLAYLRNSPDALHDWKPQRSMARSGSTPRGWEQFAKWLMIDERDVEVLSGVVGKGRATEALAFEGLIADLPDINQIYLDPENAPVPENPSARYLVAMALADKMDGRTFGAACRYLQRLPQMFRALSIRDGFRAEVERQKAGKLPKDHKRLATSADFSAWAVSADGKAIMVAAGQ